MVNVLRERHRDESGQVMGHSGFKLVKMKGIREMHSKRLIQHHTVVQPLTAIHRLAKPPFEPRQLVQITIVLQKSSQQKQTT